MKIFTEAPRRAKIAMTFVGLVLLILVALPIIFGGWAGLLGLLLTAVLIAIMIGIGVSTFVIVGYLDDRNHWL